MKRMNRLMGLAVLALLGWAALLSCRAAEPRLKGDLSIVSGSENSTLEPIIERFARQHRVSIEMKYLGSVDIMLELKRPEFPYDAVWPANSLWVSLGDRERHVKYLKSIVTSPVVFGIRRSKAEALGFVGKQVYVGDILAEIRSGALSFMMTSATQSNSGASAYLGFLYALLGSPDVLTSGHLASPELRRDIRDLLGGINRSSGSSGWLKELFVESEYDAMVNYEALMIEANQELTAAGREPLYVVYPVDGIVIADSPLGYVHKGDERKEALFLALQEYLLSEEVQSELAALGRRTGFGGTTGPVDPKVFNPEWGIDTRTILSPFRLPSAEVIEEALFLYQTAFRKPSFTVFAVDFSGSMAEKGEKELKEAMALLLDQERAREVMLQAGGEDLTVIIPFSDRLWGQAEVAGNDPEVLAGLLEEIRRLNPGGSTDIYRPVIAGLERLAKEPELRRYIPAIILMTDGESNAGLSFGDLEREWRRAGLDVPVFCIMFGNAQKSQLDAIAALSRGRVFDGRKNLVDTFRNVKGYN